MRGPVRVNGCSDVFYYAYWGFCLGRVNIRYGNLRAFWDRLQSQNRAQAILPCHAACIWRAGVIELRAEGEQSVRISIEVYLENVREGRANSGTPGP